MRVRDIAALSWESLARHRLRACLTMLGVVFGVGAVVGMMAIGEGAQREALEIVASMGIQNIRVQAVEYEDEDLREIRKESLGLSFADVEAVRRVLPQVESVAAVRSLRVDQVVGPGGRGQVPVDGVSPSYRELSGLRLAEGAFFDFRDDRAVAPVCVLGAEAKRTLFGFEDALGRSIKINDAWFHVMGVLEERGFLEDSFEGIKLQDISYRIFIPVRTALRRFERGPLEEELDAIHLRIDEESDPRPVARVLSGLFEEIHNGVEDTTLVVPAALLDQSRRTQRIFNIVMSCIAGISLLVGGIGIMNIMLAGVLERTREIGLRRAVGARRVDIRRQFLAEALAISLTGGVAGVLLGAMIARLVALGAGWTVAVTPGAVILAFAVCSGVGLVFGSYPASQAARLDPIEALRHE